MSASASADAECPASLRHVEEAGELEALVQLVVASGGQGVGDAGADAAGRAGDEDAAHGDVRAVACASASLASGAAPGLVPKYDDGCGVRR